MKPKIIAVIGILGSVVGVVLSFYSAIPMLILALVLCFVIVLGFLWGGHRSRQFWIPTHVNTDEDSLGRVFRIEGREFSAQTLPFRLEFSIHSRNLHLLLAIALIASGAIFAILTGKISIFRMVDPDSELYWLYYIICYLMFILLLPTCEWLLECALIRSPVLTLANVQSDGKLIRYDFRGPRGGYHGGTALNFGGPQRDSLKVVLCNPANPDANKLSSGMLFHRIRWSETSIPNTG